MKWDIDGEILGRSPCSEGSSAFSLAPGSEHFCSEESGQHFSSRQPRESEQSIKTTRAEQRELDRYGRKTLTLCLETQTNAGSPLSARGIDPEKHPELHAKELAEMIRLVHVSLECDDLVP